MATGKTSTLTLRIEPSLKNALRTAAEREHRSIANMIEVLIRDHCNRTRIAIATIDGPERADRHAQLGTKEARTERSKRAKIARSSRRP